MGRTPCCDKNGLKKGPWTPEEDHKLSHYIQQHGPGNWRNLPKMAGLQRCGKSCRLRWTNYLRPDIKRGRFTFEEEETIIQLHSVLGNKWSAIAARLPGRTDNEIKNYWNTHIRKRLIQTGIDPVTHAPRLNLSSLLNSAQLNLSNLLGLQTLVNPMAMKLLATLLSPENQNPENLLQKFNENQLLNSPFENQTTPLPQYNPFPNISTSNASFSSYQNQLPNMHENIDHFSLQENSMPSDASYLCEENCGLGILGQMSSDFTENTILHSLNNDHNNLNNQNFGFDSVFSTPISASPLNSSSTFINSACTEDEKESYCSNLMKFEIPEGFDFDDFL